MITFRGGGWDLWDQRGLILWGAGFVGSLPHGMGGMVRCRSNSSFFVFVSDDVGIAR